MGQKVSASSGGGDFQILDAGTHAAVCTWIVGVGPQKVEWQGKEKEQEKLKLRFEVPAERVEWETKDGEKGEGPIVIWGTYTASLGEKAKLRAHLESWRGRKFTKDELDGFDMDNILGKPCLLTVVHNQADNGKTYANIKGISKLMKGMEAPQAEGDLVSFNFYDHTTDELLALPEWLQELVRAGKDLAKEQAARTESESAPAGATSEPDDPEDPGFDDSDIPF